MTPGQLATLSSLPGFPAFARELIRVAGMTAAAALITAWGGQEWRLPFVVNSSNQKGERRWRELTHVVGEAAAARIVTAWPGEIIYIPLCNLAKGKALEAEMKKEYDRLVRAPLLYSHRDAVFFLGVKHHKNYRSIERILNRPETEEKPPAQLGLF
jgi:hypothetical protein